MNEPGPLLRYLRGQAAYCASHGSPMYGVLGGLLADDVEAGGLTADLLDRWTGPDVDAAAVAAQVPALRLLGGLHRLVLAREAPELALYYPSVGGAADLRSVRPALAGALVEHEAVLRRGLERAPQTNEVGRSAPLLGALRHVSDWSGGRPVRLFEIGASGGLNLRVDRLPIGPGLAIDSPIPLPAAPPFEVVERVGGDLHPVDPATTEGRLTLTSYVWPDDARRLERLRSALAIAQDEPAQLLRIGAADLVESIELRPGLVTVLWHSVMWQYVEAVERARVHAAVARLGEQASAAARFAYVRFEWEGDPTSENDGYHVVRLSTWPDGPGDGPSGRLAGRALGTAPAHGAPVAWQPAG